MEILSDSFKNFWQLATSYIGAILSLIRIEILYFGLLAGFFCLAPEKPARGYRHGNNLLHDIRRASSILAIITVIAVAVYVFYLYGVWQFFYYVCSLLLGLLFFWLIFLVLNLIGFLGKLFHGLIAILSGPVLIFLAWFFYTGELVRMLENLPAKLPF